jgi:hypothetical protein
LPKLFTPNDFGGSFDALFSMISKHSDEGCPVYNEKMEK